LHYGGHRDIDFSDGRQTSFGISRPNDTASSNSTDKKWRKTHARALSGIRSGCRNAQDAEVEATLLPKRPSHVLVHENMGKFEWENILVCVSNAILLVCVLLQSLAWSLMVEVESLHEPYAL
jgi:hypothetical protein